MCVVHLIQSIIGRDPRSAIHDPRSAIQFQIADLILQSDPALPVPFPRLLLAPPFYPIIETLIHINNYDPLSLRNRVPLYHSRPLHKITGIQCQSVCASRGASRELLLSAMDLFRVPDRSSVDRSTDRSPDRGSDRSPDRGTQAIVGYDRPVGQGTPPSPASGSTLSLENSPPASASHFASAGIDETDQDSIPAFPSGRVSVVLPADRAALKASIDSLYDYIESREDLAENYSNLQDELRRERERGDRLERIVQTCRESARPFVDFSNGRYAALQQRHAEAQKTIEEFVEALQDREELR